MPNFIEAGQRDVGGLTHKTRPLRHDEAFSRPITSLKEVGVMLHGLEEHILSTKERVIGAKEKEAW